MEDTWRLENALRQHAYVLGQVALLNAEVAGMQAENAKAVQNGHTPPYGEDAFERVSLKYEVDPNSVVTLFTY